MVIRMKALRTFAGVEGFFKRGESFEVEDFERATVLSESGLAKMAGEQEGSKKEEETVQPPAPDEMWGLTSLGGGWYVLPNEERVQGFENAKKELFVFLAHDLDVKKEEVKLMEPLEMRNGNEPRVIFTGEPESTDEIVALSFENDVDYLGGGWYQLPTGERVQGRESAMDVYRVQMEESEES